MNVRNCISSLCLFRKNLDEIVYVEIPPKLSLDLQLLTTSSS